MTLFMTLRSLTGFGLPNSLAHLGNTARNISWHVKGGHLTGGMIKISKNDKIRNDHRIRNDH